MWTVLLTRDRNVQSRTGERTFGTQSEAVAHGVELVLAREAAHTPGMRAAAEFNMSRYGEWHGTNSDGAWFTVRCGRTGSV